MSLLGLHTVQRSLYLYSMEYISINCKKKNLPFYLNKFKRKEKACELVKTECDDLLASNPRKTFQYQQWFFFLFSRVYMICKSSHSVFLFFFWKHGCIKYNLKTCKTYNLYTVKTGIIVNLLIIRIKLQTMVL